MAPSKPVSFTIPILDTGSVLLDLGQNSDGTVEVPPLSEVSKAGWYRYSATPGAMGSAVLLGHVDSATQGAGVFFRLGSLQPGDEVDVERADHTTAVFRIDRVAEYPKSAFPTSLVYGDTNYASLKLVTCGGNFNSATRSYDSNVVAFASLVRTHL
jgi:hypothetical protein